MTEYTNYTNQYTNVCLCEFYEPTASVSSLGVEVAINIEGSTDPLYRDVDATVTAPMTNLVCTTKKEIMSVANKSKVFTSVYAYGYSYNSGKCRLVLEFGNDRDNTGVITRTFDIVAGRANALYCNIDITYALFLKVYVYTDCNFVPDEVLLSSKDGSTI